MKYHTYILSSMAFIACITALSTRQTTSSSTLPQCFYDIPCQRECISSPHNISWCQQSIDPVCNSLDQVNLNGSYQDVQFNTGNTTSLLQDGCIAVLVISDVLTKLPTREQCHDAFRSLLDCTNVNVAHAHYNANCLGGTINAQTCMSGGSRPVDPTLPAYVLSSGDEVHYGGPGEPLLVYAANTLVNGKATIRYYASDRTKRTYFVPVPHELM